MHTNTNTYTSALTYTHSDRSPLKNDGSSCVSDDLPLSSSGAREELQCDVTTDASAAGWWNIFTRVCVILCVWLGWGSWRNTIWRVGGPGGPCCIIEPGKWMRAYTRCHPLPLPLASVNFPPSFLVFSSAVGTWGRENSWNFKSVSVCGRTCFTV